MASLKKYVDLLDRQEAPVEWSENLTPEQGRLERWMLALRLSDGFPDDWLSEEGQKKRALTLRRHGLLEPHPSRPSHLRLTPRGFALSDQVISALS